MPIPLICRQQLPLPPFTYSKELARLLTTSEFITQTKLQSTEQNSPKMNLRIVASLAMVASVIAQGVTEKIAPEGDPPNGCKPDFDGPFEITAVPLADKAKRDSVLEVCDSLWQLQISDVSSDLGSAWGKGWGDIAIWLVRKKGVWCDVQPREPIRQVHINRLPINDCRVR